MSTLVEYFDRTFYADRGEGWDDALYRAAVLRHAHPDASALDLGAGRGANPATAFREEVREVFGVDVDDAVLENQDVDDARVIGEDGRIPYEDERFDLIVSSYVLEHVEDPVSFFSEVARVLRPGGVFVARTPNHLHYVPLIARLTPQRFHVYINARRGREEQDTFPTCYRANSPTAVRQLAEGAGLEVVDIQRHDGRPEYLRFNALTYSVGLLYERISSSSELFAWMRPLLIIELRKPLRTG
jgi:SAM-dependent methyltransferase